MRQPVSATSEVWHNDRFVRDSHFIYNKEVKHYCQNLFAKTTALLTLLKIYEIHEMNHKRCNMVGSVRAFAVTDR